MTRLAGLFLFEFMVVLLGVLAAQAMADWAEDRRLGREATAQFEQVRRQAVDVARALHFWKTVGPCMSERALSVARAAANGGALAASDIGRPALPVTQMPAWDQEVRRAAFARLGEERMDAIYYFENRAMVMAATSIRVRDAWSTFALLDPANGTLSDVDRGNVRLAAISVLDSIRLLGYSDPTEQMETLGVPREEWQQLDLEDTRIDECGLISNWR